MLDNPFREVLNNPFREAFPFIKKGVIKELECWGRSGNLVFHPGTSYTVEKGKLYTRIDNVDSIEGLREILTDELNFSDLDVISLLDKIMCIKIYKY